MPARPARSTSLGRLTRRAVSPTGHRRLRRFRRTTVRRSAHRSTVATSTRTSVRGIAESRSGARAASRPRMRRRTSRSSNGSPPATTSSCGSTRGCTSRGTTPAGCAATRSWRPGTSAGRRNGTPSPRTHRATTRCCATTPSGRSRGWRHAVCIDASRRERLRQAEQWIASVRLGAVLFAVLAVGVFSTNYPRGYERLAWITTGVFAAGAVVLFVLSRSTPRVIAIGLTALVFDTAAVAAYAMIYSYEYGSPTRWALIFPVVEGALRYGLVGGAGVAIALIPFFVFAEWWRAHRFGPPGFVSDRVSFPAGVLLLTGLIVGWLVERLNREAARAKEEAAEAAELRDQLGRRVDVLEASSRCARALGSSLELEQAFGAFIRELQGLVPFSRPAIVLIEHDSARVIATAGAGADDVFPAGSGRPMRGSVLEDVLKGQPVLRQDMADVRYPEEQVLLELGLCSRAVGPLLVGARAIGMLAIVREEPNAFTPDEVELVSLLGRLAATA